MTHDPIALLFLILMLAGIGGMIGQSQSGNKKARRKQRNFDYKYGVSMTKEELARYHENKAKRNAEDARLAKDARKDAMLKFLENLGKIVRKRKA